MRGVREFWRQDLRRLKYYNPGISVTVDQPAVGLSQPSYISVQYESPDRQILQRIDASYGEFSRLESKRVDPANQKKTTTAAAVTQDPSEIGAEIARRDLDVLSHAPKDEIHTKTQLNPDSSSSSTNPPQPQTIYTRTVTLPAFRSSPQSIWRWIMKGTGCETYQRQMSTEEQKERGELQSFFRKADIDRKRVKEGLDKVKREKQELKLAREAADRLASEG